MLSEEVISAHIELNRSLFSASLDGESFKKLHTRDSQSLIMKTDKKKKLDQSYDTNNNIETIFLGCNNPSLSTLRNSVGRKVGRRYKVKPFSVDEGTGWG